MGVKEDLRDFLTVISALLIADARVLIADIRCQKRASPWEIDFARRRNSYLNIKVGCLFPSCIIPRFIAPFSASSLRFLVRRRWLLMPQTTPSTISLITFPDIKEIWVDVRRINNLINFSGSGKPIQIIHRLN